MKRASACPRLAAVLLALGCSLALATAPAAAAPGPMPPKAPNCPKDVNGAYVQPCAATPTASSTRVTAPRGAFAGTVVSAAVGGQWSYLPANRWEFTVPGSKMGICRDPRAGYGGTFDPPGSGDGLECKFRFDGRGAYRYDAATGTWQSGQPEGWVRVSLYLLYGTCCNPQAEYDETWMALYANTPSPTPTPAPCTGSTCKRPKDDLEVSVVPDGVDKDSAIKLEQTRDGVDKRQVKVTVTVKNTGAGAVGSVELPEKLTIGNKAGDREVLAKPIKHAKTALPQSLGTIAAGASRQATYILEAEGDGEFELDALVTGVRDGRGVAGLGRGKLLVKSQSLVETVQYGRAPQFSAKADGAPSKLVKGGTAFTYHVTLENRSYHKRLIVSPPYPRLCGNAHDGRVLRLDYGQPIPGEGDPSSLASVEPAPIVVLEPRETRDLEAVVRTLTSVYLIGDVSKGEGLPSAQCAAAGTRPNTGTRATAEFFRPDFGTLPARPAIASFDSIEATQKEIVAADPATDARVFQHDGSSWRTLAPEEKSMSYRFGVDDRSPKTVPYSDYLAAWAVSVGLVKAGFNVGYGLIHGIFVDLPVLAYKGLTGLPRFVMYTIDHDNELWKVARGNPALLALYTNPMTSMAARMYIELPGIAKNTAALATAVNKATFDHMAKIENEWQVGDWQGAVTSWTAEGGELASTLIAPEALVGRIAGPTIRRIPQLTRALEGSRLAAARLAENGLELYTRSKVVSARVAVKALRSVVKPYYQFKNAEITKLFGLSVKESNYLRRLAKSEQLIITLRSRAVQSIKWLEKGAFLKPGWIKLKGVNYIDAQYLGYRFSDLGLVVIRKPIAEDVAGLKRLLAGKYKLAADSAEFKSVVARYETRLKEWNKEAKAMRELVAKDGADARLGGKWDFNGNGVNPRIKDNEATSAGFRLYDDGKGNLYPQLWPGKRKPKWKKPPANAVTGDIDFLDIRHADGRPLTESEHVDILQKLRFGASGSEHPESATWILEGKADFDAKHEFLGDVSVAEMDANNGLGACCHVQFGPDLEARAVQYNKKKSEFKSALDYSVWWEGGYQFAVP